jgi:hypothetical protein
VKFKKLRRRVRRLERDYHGVLRALRRGAMGKRRLEDRHRRLVHVVVLLVFVMGLYLLVRCWP